MFIILQTTVIITKYIKNTRAMKKICNEICILKHCHNSKLFKKMHTSKIGSTNTPSIPTTWQYWKTDTILKNENSDWETA